MASFTIQGPAESIYAYTRRSWDDMRANLDKGLRPAVSNDDDGANAAARYIFAALKKNPGAVTEALPPDYTGILKIIQNPANPLTWVTQKAGQAAQKAVHNVEVNLDKPAQLLQDIGNALPWYTKPGALVGILAFSLIAPALFGKSIEGVVRGLKGKAKNYPVKEKISSLRKKLKAAL